MVYWAFSDGTLPTRSVRMGLPCPREDNQTAFPRPSHGALKPPVIHGINGVSQKAAGAGHASHYTSLTRRETHGEIVLDGPRILYASTRRQPDRMGLVQQALRKRPAHCTMPRGLATQSIAYRSRGGN